MKWYVFSCFLYFKQIEEFIKISVLLFIKAILALSI